MIRILIPLIVGHLILQRCPKACDTNDPLGNSIRQNMWPILLVAFGFAWNLTSIKGTRTMDIAYLAVTLIMAWWLHIQFCEQTQEKSKMVLLLLALGSGFLVYTSAKYSVLASVMLSIVLIWLLFAERLQLPRIKIQLPSIQIKLPQLKYEPGSASVTPGHTDITVPTNPSIGQAVHQHQADLPNNPIIDIDATINVEKFNSAGPVLNTDYLLGETF